MKFVFSKRFFQTLINRLPMVVNVGSLEMFLKTFPHQEVVNEKKSLERILYVQNDRATCVTVYKTSSKYFLQNVHQLPVA